MDIKYNKETLRKNKRDILDTVWFKRETYWRAKITDFNWQYKMCYKSKHIKAYVDNTPYSFDFLDLKNLSLACLIKNFPFEQYVVHEKKDPKLEIVKTVNVKPFLLTMATFKEKLVPILGIKIDN